MTVEIAASSMSLKCGTLWLEGAAPGSERNCVPWFASSALPTTSSTESSVPCFHVPRWARPAALL